MLSLIPYKSKRGPRKISVVFTALDAGPGGIMRDSRSRHRLQTTDSRKFRFLSRRSTILIAFILLAGLTLASDRTLFRSDVLKTAAQSQNVDLKNIDPMAMEQIDALLRE